MDVLKSFLRKYQKQILYVFFGGLTTLVDTLCYLFCYDIIGLPNVPSTILAWLLAVVFAFITNKLWVFESKSFDKVILRKEILSFFGCRLATGALDVLIMFLFVDVFQWNSLLCKIVCNIIVIISNYIASMMIVFKK